MRRSRPPLAAAFVACLAGVALSPALYAGRLAARVRPAAAAWGGRTRAARRATGLLIALAACFAFALLQSTTLAVASARHLESLPLGFEASYVLVAKARPLERDVADDAHLRELTEVAVKAGAAAERSEGSLYRRPAAPR